MSEKAAKSLSIQDWEHVLQDFGKDPEDAQRKWIAGNSGHTLLEQALQLICKKDLALRLQLCIFLEEQARLLIGSAVQSGLTSIVDSTRNLLHASLDGNVVTSTVKEQMMVTASVVVIELDALHSASRALETLVELLLGFISRTNYAPERHVRGVACECLRELEMAYPCLLNACLGHVFNLCQADRTHVGQSYVLLLTTIVHNLCQHMFTISSKPSAGQQGVMSTAVPVIPFSVPVFLVGSRPGEEALGIPSRELTNAGLKEFRRVVSFLLERPDLLTEFGLLEFVAHLVSIAKALDLHGSLLKNQFASLSHSYSPTLCHAFLMMSANFVEAFAVDEGSIVRQLMVLCRDTSQPLSFRLLSIHWLLGIEMLGSPRKQRLGLVSSAPGLYPLVFEPLLLKAAKLNALAYCAASIQISSSTSDEGQIVDSLEMSHQLVSRGMVSVSAYKWLPPGSTETRLAMQLLNRFLTLAVPHSSGVDLRVIALFAKSLLFKTVEDVLLSMAMDMPGLVPSLLSFIDRLLSCVSHKRLGERLLHTFSDKLLPRLSYDVLLPAYFPLFERMGENTAINPRPIVQAMTIYIKDRVRASKGKGSWVMWIRGSQVLGICRTLMAHHYSSRIYGALSELLGFLTQHFPDLELRDSARMYLRMVIAVPGRKLRSMLNPKDEQSKDSASNDMARFSTFLKSPPPVAEAKKRKLRVAAYILLSREKPLTVPHSWSMVLYNEIESSFKSEQVKYPHGVVTESEVTEAEADKVLLLEPSGFEARKEVPRVTDAKTSHMLQILRWHFSNILDFSEGTGFKIHIHCQLKFQGEVKLRLLAESDTKGQSPGSPGLAPQVWESPETWPALYAVVVCFSTSGPYGPILKLRIPFVPSALPSTRVFSGRCAAKNGGNHSMVIGVSDSSQQDIVLKGESDDGLFVTKDSLQTVKHAQARDEAAALEASMVLQRFIVELEPKQPVPTWIEAKISFSDECGQTVRGQLDSIPVGFEDLFMVAPCPEDVGTPNEAQYRFDLFNALWDACGGPGKLGGETFLLKGGRTGVDVKGTESVKLLETPAERLVDGIGHWLLSYVVAVSGGAIVEDTGSWEGFSGVIWQEEDTASVRHGRPPSLLRLTAGDSPSSSQLELSKQLVVAETSDGINLQKGCFYVLIFLPPRYHMMFKMEVSAYSTLVRIRTDHWPSLAYVDEYLEALTMVR